MMKTTSPPDPLESLLACPICRSSLRIDDGVATCTGCGLTYARTGAVFSFITPRMYGSQEEFDAARGIIEFWGKGWEKRLQEPEHRFAVTDEPYEVRQHAKTELEGYERRRQLYGAELNAKSLQGKTALNIGCGSGTESLVLASNGASCFGMDITSEAANSAARVMRIAGWPGMGIQADARFVPLATSSMDVVFSNGVLHHSPDIQRSVDEIHRVLKPGGAAYVMLYAKWSTFFMQHRLKGILHGYITPRQQRDYISKYGEGAWITGERRNPLTDLFTKAECRQLFAQFRRVSVRKADFAFSNVAGVRRIVNALPPRVRAFLDEKIGPLFGPLFGASLYIRAEK